LNQAAANFSAVFASDPLLPVLERLSSKDTPCDGELIDSVMEKGDEILSTCMQECDTAVVDFVRHKAAMASDYDVDKDSVVGQAVAAQARVYAWAFMNRLRREAFDAWATSPLIHAGYTTADLDRICSAI
jgi:hypothetical protein